MGGGARRGGDEGSRYDDVSAVVEMRRKRFARLGMHACIALPDLFIKAFFRHMLAECPKRSEAENHKVTVIE